MLTITTMIHRKIPFYQQAKAFPWKDYQAKELLIYPLPAKGWVEADIREGKVYSIYCYTDISMLLMTRMIHEMEVNLKEYEDCHITGYVSLEDDGSFIATGIQPKSGELETTSEEFAELEELGFNIPEYLLEDNITWEYIKGMDWKEFVIEQGTQKFYLTANPICYCKSEVKDIIYTMMSGKIDGLVPVIRLSKPQEIGNQGKLDKLNAVSLYKLLESDSYSHKSMVNYTYDKTNGVIITPKEG